MFKLDWIALALAAMLTGNAWAIGGSDGGGGNGAEGQILEATYRATDRLPGYKKYKAVRDFVESVVPNFAYRMDKFAWSLEWTLTKQNLPYRGNDIDYLVPTQQTAVQHDGLVYVDTRITENGAFSESWPMLIMHEVLLRILLARNEQFKLGLTEAQIHHAVRSVVFRLFDFAARPHPEIYDIPVQELLFKNHFGFFAYKAALDKAIAQLPEAIQKMSAYVDESCRAGLSQLVNESFSKLTQIQQQACGNCDQTQVGGILSLWGSSYWVRPSENTKNFFPPITDGQTIYTLYLTAPTCAQAKKLSASVPTRSYLDKEISWITHCGQFSGVVPGDNNCDAETFLTGWVQGRDRVKLDP